MTEDEAQRWTADRFGTNAADRLAKFADLVAEENQHQNLISPATIPQIWSRHIVDSLQLVTIAHAGSWVDIGTGGGFPGLAVALVRAEGMTLVEPRRKRAAFLQQCVNTLQLAHVTVAAFNVEQLRGPAQVISARAVASIENLLRAAAHCATPETQWLLPRGSIDQSELGQIAKRHGLMFHVEQSITQAESSIVVMKAR